jgi:hypothetical protein
MKRLSGTLSPHPSTPSAHLPAPARFACCIVVVGLLSIAGGARVHAGHEMPFYPSYYPQEITLETLPETAAPARFAKNTLHGYVGGDPFGGKAAPKGVTAIESLGAWVVVTFNPAAKALATAEARCAAARRVVAGLGEVSGFRRHPHAVTPFHSDYLHHADRAEVIGGGARARPPAGEAPLRLRARGRIAEALVGGVRAPAGGAWDAVVEEVAAGGVLAAHGATVNGWMGPPWIKEGWFHAWALLAPSITDGAARRRIDEALARVTAGSERLEERIERERELLGALGAGCERVVAGYTVRREWVNTDYSAGVENVAADAQAGLSSAIFVRTVKLKDFPWNGWLTLGLRERAAAAWNPIGGFTDAAGRLIWAAVGDPALFSEPYNNGWTDNRVRVESVETTGRPIPIPRDALLPERGTGVLREVGNGKTARARVTYQVLTSAFQDGTRTSATDALYAYAFATAWATGNGTGHDPHVERATALAREALAGVKVLRVESKTLRFGEIAMQYEVPIVEVYLARGGLEPRQLAALAPPWSAVPWHVLVLMAEAVRRGMGAFSAAEASRRGVPWLDLVRDARVRDRLTALVKELEAQGYVPPALRRLVDEREARRRWGALGRFVAERRHFLVTNGPYEVHAAGAGRVVLRVVRDFSYPLGVGSYNRYPIPLRAFVTRAEVRGDRVEMPVEVERVERFAREHRIVTEPLAARFGQKDAELPVCRFVVLGPGGVVTRAGTAAPVEPGICAVAIGGLPRPATVLVAPSLNGNHVDLQIKAMRVDSPAAPGAR